MRSFASALARLDAETEPRLGDFLFYDIGGLLAVEPVSGFITDPAELQLEGLDVNLDTVGQRRRLKIAAAIVEQPSKQDRVRSDHPLLAGWIWKVMAWRRIQGGRYWLTDLEKAGQR